MKQTPALVPETVDVESLRLSIPPVLRTSYLAATATPTETENITTNDSAKIESKSIFSDIRKGIRKGLGITKKSEKEISKSLAKEDEERELASHDRLSVQDAL